MGTEWLDNALASICARWLQEKTRTALGYNKGSSHISQARTASSCGEWSSRLNRFSGSVVLKGSSGWTASFSILLRKISAPMTFSSTVMSPPPSSHQLFRKKKKKGFITQKNLNMRVSVTPSNSIIEMWAFWYILMMKKIALENKETKGTLTLNITVYCHSRLLISLKKKRTT